MGPRHCDSPCFVSPHPDLLRKLSCQSGALNVQSSSNIAPVHSSTSHFSRPKVPGLNDGTIFPPVSLVTRTGFGTDSFADPL